MKDTKKLVNLIMNPVRQRICQFMLKNEKGTTAMIREELNDVPPASLYRHMKILFDNGVIEVAEEKKIRGTIEKTYKLAENPFGEPEEGDVGALIENGVFSILTLFQKYFADESNDPVKDMLSFSTSTLMLTDEEFADFLMKINKLVMEVVSNEAGGERKERSIAFMSLPVQHKK